MGTAPDLSVTLAPAAKNFASVEAPEYMDRLDRARGYIPPTHPPQPTPRMYVCMCLYVCVCVCVCLYVCVPEEGSDFEGAYAFFRTELFCVATSSAVTVLVLLLELAVLRIFHIGFHAYHSSPGSTGCGGGFFLGSRSYVCAHV